MIGQSASHYRILERLGAGAMGEVFLAEDVRLHRRVALKMLPAECSGDGPARARLLREARLASGLNHPNIAVIYEIDEIEQDDGWRSFIAMEYVAGETLAERLRRAPMEVGEALEVVAQVAEALAEAHDHGVVHRDVKPSNVMLTASGRVKILDFGLAHYVPPDDETAATWSREGADGLVPRGALIGTLAYMSPEQVRGGAVDARSDVFSLGVLAYELLAGSAPFKRTNAVEVIDAILHDEPPPLSLRDPSAPELARIVRRMLSKDPAERYPRMGELCADLSALRRGRETGRPVLPLSALAPAVAVLSFVNITRVPEDDWLGTGIAETVAADLKAVEGLTVIGRERIHELLRRLAPAASDEDDALGIRVGRELGARWALTGGYQRMGERVRVTARLTEVETGAVIRTLKVDGSMDEIFSVQDRIVAELTAGLRLTVSPADRERDETQTVDAYEAFSRGMLNLREESHESIDRAILFFERAVRLDPGYARAHMQVASAYDLKASYLVVPELHERALGHFRKALELRPGLVQAWREMGQSLIALGREDEGFEAIRRALSLDPDDAAARASMGRAHFIGLGDFAEAAVWYERALCCNPKGGWYALQLSHCCALLRDFVRGEEAAGQAIGLQEEFLSGQDAYLIVGSYMRLGHVFALQGRPADALAQFLRELAFLQRVDAKIEHALKPRILIELHQRIGGAQLKLGREAEGRAALAQAVESFERRLRLGADEPFSRYYAAGAYALLGDGEHALASLAKAVQGRRRLTIARARIEPEFDSIRDEPRFRALIGG